MSSEAANYWNNIHQTKKSDVSWWQDEKDLWLDLLQHCSGSKTLGAIDVGAGSSYFIDALSTQNYSPLCVNDLSASALEEISNRFMQRHVELTVLQGDVCDLQLKNRVGLWHDRAVFHFLTDSASKAEYKNSLLRNTTNTADFIIATFSPEGPETCSGLQVQRWTAEDLARFFAPEFSLVFNEVRMHHTPWGGSQSFTVCVMHRNGE
jgi:hypothetical protein